MRTSSSISSWTRSSSSCDDLSVDPAGRDDLVADVELLEHLLAPLCLLPLRADEQEVQKGQHHEEEDEDRIH